MIDYRLNVPLDAREVARVFDDSGLVRPTGDLDRIARMLAASNLVWSAWSDGALVGVCRALTDHSYCCYLSDLAVVKALQHQGVGRQLIQRVRDTIGEEVTLVLVSSQDAVDFYPKAGFAKADTAYIIRRSK